MRNNDNFLPAFVLSVIGLMLCVVALAFALGVVVEPARVGDHNVPSGLHCQEDEVIGVAPGHADAICIHIDVIRGEK